MAGTEMRVRRVGRGVLLEPIDRDLKDIAAIFAEIDRMGSVDFEPNERPEQGRENAIHKGFRPIFRLSENSVRPP